jgi:hypothetical protein
MCSHLTTQLFFEKIQLSTLSPARCSTLSVRNLVIKNLSGIAGAGKIASSVFRCVRLHRHEWAGYDRHLVLEAKGQPTLREIREGRSDSAFEIQGSGICVFRPPRLRRGLHFLDQRGHPLGRRECSRQRRTLTRPLRPVAGLTLGFRSGVQGLTRVISDRITGNLTRMRTLSSLRNQFAVMISDHGS